MFDVAPPGEGVVVDNVDRSAGYSNSCADDDSNDGGGRVRPVVGDLRVDASRLGPRNDRDSGMR
jgi:hypothetical protein